MKRFNTFTLVAVTSLVFAFTVMCGGVAGAAARAAACSRRGDRMVQRLERRCFRAAGSIIPCRGDVVGCGSFFLLLSSSIVQMGMGLNRGRLSRQRCSTVGAATPAAIQAQRGVDRLHCPVRLNL